jgi:general secretion pathway protein C
MQVVHWLQKHVFLVTVGSAVLLGASLAYLFSNLIPFVVADTTLASSSASGDGPRREEGDVFRPLGDYEPIVTGAFFRDSGTAAPKTGPGETGEGEIQLSGVLAGPPQFARALIQVVGKPEMEAYRIGDSVAGFKITQIQASSIVVERGSGSLRIYVGEKSGEAAQAQVQAAPGKPATQAATKVVVTRERLQKAMKNPEELTQNRYAPVTRDGRVLGLKLFFVQPGNFLYDLGARSGDIIRRFNGEPLESQDKMILMYQSLQTATKITLEVERGGQVIPYEIVIQ